MTVLSKDASLIVLGENSKTHVSWVQLWRSVWSSHRMQVLSKDAGLVIGCRSCHGMQVSSTDASLVEGCRSCQSMHGLSKDACLVEGCKSCQRMQDLSKDASLVKECFLETAGCGSVDNPQNVGLSNNCWVRMGEITFKCLVFLEVFGCGSANSPSNFGSV